MKPVFLIGIYEDNSPGLRGQVSAIETIPGRDRVLSATNEGIVSVWSGSLWRKSNALEVERPGGFSGVLVACHIGGKLAVTGHREEICLWQAQDDASVSLAAVSERITDMILALAFHPDGSVVYSTSDGIFRLDSMLKNPRPFTSQNVGGDRLLFSPDGEFLAVHHGEEIKLLNSRDELMTLVPDQHDPHFGMSFSPSSNALAIGGTDGTLRLINPKTGRTVYSVPNAHGTRIYSVRFNQAGTVLATGGHDGGIKLWNVDGERFSYLFSLFDRKLPVLSLAFSSDDQILMAGGLVEGKILFWRAHWKTWLRMACRRVITQEIFNELSDIQLKAFIRLHAGQAN